MPVISVRIPQLGEGLQEALLVEFLKKPGDRINRDEPIYTMETDKATTDVESPYSGTLVQWTVQPGTVLEIGAEIAKMEVAEGVKEMLSSHAASNQSSTSESATALSRSDDASTSLVAQSASQPPSDGGESAASPGNIRNDILIPPKTRKYLKDLGLSDQIDKIPVRGSKMMPEDVDAYVAAAKSSPLTTPTGSQKSTDSPGDKPDRSEPYSLVPLPKSQLTLNYRMARGSGSCVPVTVVADIDWTQIQAIRQNAVSLIHSNNSSFENMIGLSPGNDPSVGGRKSNANVPTGFAIACWAVVQSMKQHDRFRSILTPDGTALKTFQHVNLGVAVALPGDEMLTAVIRKADQMQPQDFFEAYEAQVQSARQGQDQADETTTLTVSNIGKVGMRIGIPAIVAPAVATLALGEVFPQPVPDGESFRFRPTVTATLSFDHRIVNGVGAANFLNQVRSNIETIL